MRARGGRDDERIEVEADAFSAAEGAHTVVGLAHFFKCRGPGFNQSDDARLVDGGLQIGVEEVGMQVDLDLVTVVEAGHGGSQVP
jgi:hypothetical protein